MFGTIALYVVPAAIFLFGLLFAVNQYKRCASNEILVIYGRVGGNQTARCIHGGGAFVIPLIQDYAYMSLYPFALEVDLQGALAKNNIRVSIPSTFTVAISTKPEIMQNAAERLLGLKKEEIMTQARDMVLGQLRLAIATLQIEEINSNRDKFLKTVDDNVNLELHKIGLEIINVNIHDITDESGYLKAIGQNAIAGALNEAKIAVAGRNKDGEIGVATATKDQQVSVAQQNAAAEVGKQEATSNQRIKVAEFNSNAIKGENDANAKIASYNATLEVAKATATRAGQVAQAEAATAVFKAEKEKELAKLEKEQLAQQQVTKSIIETQANANAEKTRIEAKGQADGILAKYEAEAKGIQLVLDAKAAGYKNLIAAASPELAPTLLMIEKMETLVTKQTEAIKNLKFDKVVVFDGGSGNGDSGVAGFVKSFAGMLPGFHEMLKSSGIDAPGYLGKLEDKTSKTLIDPKANNS
jgi:flotillin